MSLEIEARQGSIETPCPEKEKHNPLTGACALVQPPLRFHTCADFATPTQAGLLTSPPAADDSPCKCGPHHSSLDSAGWQTISRQGQIFGILGFAGRQSAAALQ